MAAATKAAKRARGAIRRTPAASTIWAWEDDPMSTGAAPVERPVPRLPRARFKLAFDGLLPPPGLHPPGSPEFRSWAAAEAIVRTIDFWSPLMPPRSTWQRGDRLDVHVDAGVDLNAYYDRASLTFFHAEVAGQTVYSAESPDVVAHECGHAILDALRPQLFDAMSAEVAALHESFGDCSAILVALQVPSMRTAVLTDTGGELYSNSRVSRLAEQLGWAIAQRLPCATDPGCLRNAVSCFFYEPPERLPIRGPAVILTSEPHSYSRVFTSAFLATLGGMFAILTREPDPDALQQATVDAGKLLVAAVQSAPIVPAYLAQVGAHMLAADQAQFSGTYRSAIRSGFIGRGLMSPSTPGQAAAAPADVVAAAAPAGRRPPPADLPIVALSAHDVGLGDRPLLVRAPTEVVRLAAPALGRDGGPAPSASPEDSARGFLRELVARDRIRLPGRESRAGRLHTHEVVEHGDALRIVRRLFDAGIPWAGGRSPRPAAPGRRP